MKPGASSATTGVLPQRSMSATARFTESPSVCGPRDHLDERHERRRVEEVEPEHVLRPARRDGDRRHRQGAGVRREERLRRRLPVERAEDRPLEVDVLERRLDDDVGRRGDRVERDRGPQVGEPTVDPLVDRVGVELELRRTPPEADANPLDPSLERLFVDVVQHDLVACLERDLGDPRAHRPRAHDADDCARKVVSAVWLVHGLTVRQRRVRPSRGAPGRSRPDARPRRSLEPGNGGPAETEPVL